MKTSVEQTPQTSSEQSQFNESIKYLPVFFVWSIIVGLWLIYTFFHCVPLAYSEHLTRHRFVWEIVVFNVSTALLWTCYAACMLVHPGTVPNTSDEGSWLCASSGASPFASSVAATHGHLTEESAAHSNSRALSLSIGNSETLQEKKRTGDKRACKWCSKYKPDRCHHCRVCRQCILRMDHHCPWIYNCVGFKNHKYFILLIFYSTIDCHIIGWSMGSTLGAAIGEPTTEFLDLFLLLFGQSLTCVMGFLVTVFLGFHIWLMLKAMTTIEFCEKSMKKGGYDTSVYDCGYLQNIKLVLGDNPILWLLPCSPPSGSGLNFTSSPRGSGGASSGPTETTALLDSKDWYSQPKTARSDPEKGDGQAQQQSDGKIPSDPEVTPESV